MLLFEEPIQLGAIGRVGQGASWDAGKAAIDQRLGRGAGAVRSNRPCRIAAAQLRCARSGGEQVGDGGDVGGIGARGGRICGGRRGGGAVAGGRRSGDVIGEPQDAARPEQRRPAAAEEARVGEHRASLARTALPDGCGGGLIAAP